MKIKFLSYLLLGCWAAFAQDTIVTFRGSKLPAKIISFQGDNIIYTRPDRSKAEQQTIAKINVWEVRHADGKTTDFFTAAEKSKSLEAIKADIVSLIDRFGYEEDSDNQKYKATFEGDYLRLAIMKKDKVKSKGFLFDFSNVYQFHPVSERGKEIAYVNIYVSFLDNPKTMKWAKQKLIMRVHGHKEGYDIMRALQYLNRLLLDKNRTK